MTNDHMSQESSNFYQSPILEALEAAGLPTADSHQLFKAIDVLDAGSYANFQPGEFEGIDCETSVGITSDTKESDEETQTIAMVDVYFHADSADSVETYVITFTFDWKTFRLIKTETIHSWPKKTDEEREKIAKSVYGALEIEDLDPEAAMLFSGSRKNAAVPHFVSRAGQVLTKSELISEPFLMKALEAFKQKKQPM